MSDPENFLSRWSRRKLEPGDREKTTLPEAKPTETQSDAVESRAPAAPAPADEPPFDPASLPPIESITAGSDIRDFLRPGIPLSLSRAALRRAWTSDPAIRDFIEIAENQWDFTDNSIAGFGPLDPADVPRQLARLLGTPEDGDRPAVDTDRAQPSPSPPENPAAESECDVASESGRAVTAQEGEPTATQNITIETPLHRNNDHDAAQNEPTDENLNYPTARHGHGSALPT